MTITTYNRSFVFETSSWFNKYRDKSSSRYPTFKAALGLFLQRGGKYIVETGCVRMLDDWGAGMSTYLFCEFLETYGGYLWSVDINPKNVVLCNQITEPFAKYRLCVQGDSLDFLSNKLPELSGFENRIDLLYLDSYDYPYGELVKKYNGNNEAFLAISDTQAMTRHGDKILPCQQHCLAEFKAAEKYLHDKSIVLIDDCGLPGGGKAGLVRDHLASKGWLCLLDLQQSLWIKEAPNDKETQGHSTSGRIGDTTKSTN